MINRRGREGEAWDGWRKRVRERALLSKRVFVSDDLIPPFAVKAADLQTQG
jgi:hypothetical protein